MCLFNNIPIPLSKAQSLISRLVYPIAMRSTLFWHNPMDNHYCMKAELFDEISKNASFELELFYDMKPGYYTFSGERKKLGRNFKEIKED